MADLGLDIRLASRTTASYTPWMRGDREGGLLVERPEGAATRASFHELTGGDAEYAAWLAFYDEVGGSRRGDRADPDEAAPQGARHPGPGQRADLDRHRRRAAQPGRRGPLHRRHRPWSRGDRRADRDVRVDGRSVADPEPLLPLPPDRQRHRRVASAVGGMGAVTDALAKAAVEAGAEIVTGAGVSAISAGPDGAEVTWHDGDDQRTVTGRQVLSGVAPWVLRILLGEGEDEESKPIGSQLKINFLLDRLPALQVRCRPGRRVRRHPPSLRGLHPAPAGVRRRCRQGGCPTRCRARSTATASPTRRSSASARARRTR